ncbi:MAG: PIN domain-containing protein [Fimbriimonadales bacterium]|nr:PIN domain-containing protein [Fimbriimonadales bacterium]
MRYLLDSSVILELLLGQAQSNTVQQLIEAAEPESLCLSDFALHSIGIVLSRLNLHQAYVRFLEDMILSGFLAVIRVPHAQLRLVVVNQLQYGLDFDDAYQYTTAHLHNLRLVSLDADYDQTPEGRLTPQQALAETSSS